MHFRNQCLAKLSLPVSRDPSTGAFIIPEASQFTLCLRFPPISGNFSDYVGPIHGKFLDFFPKKILFGFHPPKCLNSPYFPKIHIFPPLSEKTLFSPTFNNFPLFSFDLCIL